MARSLGALTLDLVARTGNFSGPLEKASKDAKRDMASIAKSVKAASSAVAAVGAVAAGTAASITAFTKNAADNAREIKNLASLSSASTAEFQRGAYAAKQAGIEQEKYGDILKDVNDKVGDFIQTGGGQMKDFFEQIAPQIGVTAEQFKKLSGPQALQLYYDSLDKANLSQSELTFYMEGIASDATALIPLLRDGGQGFADMATEADKLGLVLSDLEIAKLDEFAVQFDRISGIASSFGNVLASELSPYLSVIADDLVEAAEGAGSLREALPGAIRDSVAAIGPLLDGLHLARNAVEALQAASGSVAQGYSLAFLTIQENATKLLDFVGDGVNEIIGAFNNLPAVDIPLIASFNDSAYMEALRSGYDEVAKRAESARADVVDVWNAPLPSRYIDELISKAEEKSASLQVGLQGAADAGAGIGDGVAAGSATAAKALDELEAKAASLLDTLYPLKKSQREYAEQSRLLERYARNEGKSADWLADAYARLDKQYQSAADAAEVYGLTGKQAAGQVSDAVDPMATAWERGIERMDDAGAQFWRSFLDGSENTFDAFKNVALDALAEVIHAYTTRQITASLSLDGSGLAGGSAPGQSGMGGLDDIGSLGKTLYNGVVDGFGAINWAGAPTSYSGGFAGSATSGMGTTTAGGSYLGGSTSNFSGLNGLASFGSSYAGSWAGNELGESVFGKHANSNIGATAGGAIGTYFGGPIGAFAGSSLGSMLDVAFGSGREYGFRFSQLDENPMESGVGQRYDTDPRYGWYSSGGYQDGELGRGRDTAFGSFGFLSKEVAEPDDLIKFLDAIEAIDNSIAQFTTTEQESAVKDALDGYYYKGDSIRDVMRQRMDVIVDETNSSFESAITRIGGSVEQQAGNLAASLQVDQISQGLADAVADDIDDKFRDALDSGDATAAAKSIAGAVDALNALGNSTEFLGVQFDATASGALEAASSIADMAGGLQSLGGLQSSYYREYFTQEEQRARLQEEINQQFDDMGRAVPQTRAEFRSLVQGLDLTTDKGQQAYVQLLRMSDSFAKLHGEAEKATESFEEVALNQQELALYSSGALAGIESAMASYQGAMTAADDIAATRKAQLEDERQALTTLGDLIDSLAVSDLATGNTLDAARRQYETLYGQARSGNTDAVQALDGATRTYLEQARGQASTALEYARTYGDVATGVSKLQEQFGDSADELGSLERIADKQLQAQERARSTLIDQLQAQIGMLDGIHTFAGLLEALPASIAGQLEGVIESPGKYGSTTPDGVYTGTSGFNGVQSSVNDIYQSYLGRNADESGLDYWTGELASGRMDLDEVRDRIAHDAAHGSHAAGLWSVPFDGYRAVLHKDEMVVPSRSGVADEFRAMAGGGGNSALIAEVRGLREQMQKLEAYSYQTVKNTHQISKLQKRWDGDGLPATREVMT